MRIGAVDIGSNTVRLLVADVFEEGPDLVEVVRLSTFTGLGRGLSANGRFDRVAVAASLAALKDYRHVSSAHGVDRVAAVATSATRDASDREAFLDDAAAVLGVRPRVIDGTEEADLSFAGASLSSPGPRPLLVIDLGGGSTEFVLGRASAEFRTSLDVGSARLTDQWFPRFPTDEESLAGARSLVASLLEPLHLPERPVSVVAVGGTFVTLGLMIEGLSREQRGSLAGRLLAADSFHPLAERLGSLTIEQIAAIPAVRAERAPVLVAGAVIASEVVRVVGTNELAVSISDLLEGLALQTAQAGEAPPSQV